MVTMAPAAGSSESCGTAVRLAAGGTRNVLEALRKLIVGASRFNQRAEFSTLHLRRQNGYIRQLIELRRSDLERVEGLIFIHPIHGGSRSNEIENVPRKLKIHWVVIGSSAIICS